jgi:peptidoglycan hydrolase-like protein with peptidoglycan-binding domain
MKRQGIVIGVIGWVAVLMGATAIWPTVLRAAEAVSGVENVEATPSLIREIQFMLLRLGMDPGFIDGIAGPQTTRAVHRFQEQYGLPVGDLVIDRKVSVTLLARMRSEASKAILGSEKKPEAPPSLAPSPAGVVVPSVVTPPPQPPPAQPPPDRFAACTYTPADFRIGGTQYTPDKFLQEGFEGSTVRAVANLKDRLNEARQLAENIGGSALAEVQRQARVLNYFSCRLKIEQASDTKK